MPRCSCGCGGVLTQQTIRKHLSGKSVPRAVQAAVKAFRTHGREFRPPQLKPAKKTRSSRRFFPSSPRQSNSEDLDPNEPSIPDFDPAMEEMDYINENEDEDNTEIQMERVFHATRDVWSGHRSNEEDDRSEGSEEAGGEDNDMNEFIDHSQDDDNYSSEDSGSESKSGHGMTMVDELGEEFEREVVANGELHILICLFNTN